MRNKPSLVAYCESLLRMSYVCVNKDERILSCFICSEENSFSSIECKNVTRSQSQAAFNLLCLFSHFEI